MTASATPVIAIVGGGWHQPASYKKLINALEGAGFQVYTTPLPSMNGDRPPTKFLKDDSKAVRQLIEPLCEHHNIIVLTHAYGGQVATNALCGLGKDACSSRGLRGGIVNICYMAAVALTERKSLMYNVRKFGHEELVPIAFDIDEDGTQLSRDPKTLLVGPGVSEEEVDEYVATFIRWNGKTMYEPLEQCAWREVPVSYIYSTQDMTVPYDYQKSMVDMLEAEGKEVDTFEIATGHCPNLTATDEVVAAIKTVAAKCK